MNKNGKFKTITFYDEDLPNMASHCEQAACGFSIYRGILVQWDEDHDERILKWIDDLPLKVADKLLAVQEHEASLALVWKPRTRIPAAYREGCEQLVDNDSWYVTGSVLLPPEPEQK